MTQKLHPGSIFGGMLLVAGSCIGAGMLGLPILTGLAGFFPSLVMLLIAWSFMTYTGLLLIEVNGTFSHQVNLLSMVQKTLGRNGRLVAWFSYLLLFYSLLVAYTVASGSVFSEILEALFHIELSPAASSTFFAALFGYIVYLGTQTVDLFNRVLMVGLIITYLGMIAVGLTRIHSDLLVHFDPNLSLLALPVLIASFGFQNMIPSLTAYMKGDLKRVKMTIIGGSLIALCIYFVWTLFVLGVVPAQAIVESYEQGAEATKALKKALGLDAVTHFAHGFAFFAIVTSFLAQGLTLTHFLADGFKKVPTKKNLPIFCFFALAPPLFFALYNPSVFYKALSFAGGICAMVLFGMLPVLMVWVGRYEVKQSSPYKVAGGKIALVCAFLFALFVIGCELSQVF